MAGEGIEVDIYHYSNYTVLRNTLQARMEPTVLEEVKARGGGSFKISLTDPKIKRDPELLAFRNIAKIKVNGKVVGAFQINTKNAVTVSAGERSDQMIEVAGEGLKIFLDDAELRPYGGWKAKSKDTRSFSFASVEGSWYKPAEWINPTRLGRVKASTTKWKTAPAKWPGGATLAYWIWGQGTSGGVMPDGDNYLRLKLPVASAGSYTLHVAVDDQYTLYLDGEAIAKTDTSSWREVQKYSFDLEAGTHIIGMKASNIHTVPSVAGILFALFRDSTPVAQVNKGTVTINIEDPAVIVQPNHGLVAGDKIQFTTTGTLPTGIQTGKDYYVAMPQWNMFNITPSPEGKVIKATGTQTGTHSMFVPAIPSKPQVVTYTGQDFTTINTAYNAAVATVNSRWSTYLALPAGKTNGTDAEKTQAKKKASAWANYQKAVTARRALKPELDAVNAANSAGITWKMQNYPTLAPGWTPGEIIKTLMNEASARGVLFPGFITRQFTDDLDSYGQSWGDSLDWTFDVGEDSLLSIVEKMEELACELWIDPTDYKLYASATERGVDRSAFKTTLGTALTNRHPNPDGATTTGYASSAATIASSASTVAKGRSATSIKYTRTAVGAVRFTFQATGLFVANTQYTIKCKIKLDTAITDGSLSYRPNVAATTGQVVLATGITLAAGDTYVADFTFTTSATTPATAVGIAFLTSTGAIGAVVEIADVTVVEGASTLGDESWSGSTPDDTMPGGFVYDWVGPINNSMSTRQKIMMAAGSKPPVVFEIGKNLRSTELESRGKIKNSLSVNTAAGWTSPVVSSPSIAKYGVIEGSLSTGTGIQVSRSLAGQIIKQRAVEEEGATYDIYPAKNDPKPMVDYDVGDWVLAPDVKGLNVKRRIVSLSVKEGNQGEPLYTIEFDTIFRTNEDRMARTLAKLGGGGVGGGYSNNKGSSPSSPSVPSIISPDTTEAPIQTAMPPTDLEAFSLGIWPPTGVTPYAEVTIEWAVVTEATDGSEIVVDYYQVWARPTDEDLDSYKMVAEVTDTQAQVQPFEPGSNWTFKVHAKIGENLSEPSEEISLTMDGPVLPMVAPSAPTLDSSNGLLLVHWNGLMSDGNVPPPQFRYIYVMASLQPGGPYVRVGGAFASRDDRDVSVPGLLIDETYDVKLVAVDGVGLESPASASASQAIIGVDLGSLDQDVKDAIEAAKEAALLAGESANLLVDPSFETFPVEEWVLGTGTTQISTDPRTGSYHLANTSSGSIRRVATYNRWMPVDPASTVVFRIYVKLQSGTAVDGNPVVRLVMRSRGEALTPVTETVLGTMTSVIAGNYLVYSATWTAPNEIFFMQPAWDIVDAVAGNTYFFDDARVVPMIGTSLIVDGAVIADKISASAVTAEKISAGAIDASKIQAEAVTAEKIQAEAVTAEKIAANSIESNHLTAGAIQTNHLSPSVGDELNLEANGSIQLIAGIADQNTAEIDEVSGNLELMQTYYTFGVDGAVISTPGSPFALALRNDRIEMLENGNVVSYWNSGTMVVNSFIGVSVILSNHQLEQYGTGTVVRAV